MSIRRVTSPAAPEPPPERWSNCLVVDGIAYVSGMTARSGDAKALAGMDEYAQAKAIFGKIKGLVEAAGGAMADVVKITVYVTSLDWFDQLSVVREELFTQTPPASAIVQVVSLVQPDLLIEIEAVAVVPA